MLPVSWCLCRCVPDRGACGRREATSPLPTPTSSSASSPAETTRPSEASPVYPCRPLCLAPGSAAQAQSRRPLHRGTGCVPNASGTAARPGKYSTVVACTVLYFYTCGALLLWVVCLQVWDAGQRAGGRHSTFEGHEAPASTICPHHKGGRPGRCSSLAWRPVCFPACSRLPCGSPVYCYCCLATYEGASRLAPEGLVTCDF